MNQWLCGLVVAAAAVGAAPSMLAASYVTVTWGDDAVHFLDQNLADLGSFATSVGLPDGVATSGNLIWVGSFTSSEVVAYDFAGTEHFHWSLPSSFSLQGLDYAGNGQLLAMDANDNTLVRLNALTGAVLGSVPAVSSSTEAVAIDGQNVWQLTDNNIYLTSLADGSIIRSIPNAAHLEAFEGTALANIGESLVLGSDSGNWYRVSKLDGSILESGNNALSMFDLQPVKSVPDAGGIGWIFALANLTLVAVKTHGRRKP